MIPSLVSKREQVGRDFVNIDCAPIFDLIKPCVSTDFADLEGRGEGWGIMLVYM